jgi:hypothetical protein
VRSFASIAGGLTISANMRTQSAGASSGCFPQPVTPLLTSYDEAGVVSGIDSLAAAVSVSRNSEQNHLSFWLLVRHLSFPPLNEFELINSFKMKLHASHNQLGVLRGINQLAVVPVSISMGYVLPS